MKKYDRVMPRVYNRSRISLKSTSFVTRHQTSPSSVLGSKPSVSRVSSGVFSDLPVVLNDYKVESEKPRRPFVVKPRKTLKSLDPALSPPRSVRRSQELRPTPHMIRSRGSAPTVIEPTDEQWPETHMRQCLSSRSHTILKDLKDEIKTYEEQKKMVRLRSDLFKSCGVMLDNTGQLAADKAVQVETGVNTDKIHNIERRHQWLRLIDREDLISKSQPKHVVCENHFHPEDIIKNSVRKLLKKNCLPSLNLPNLKKVDKYTQVEILTPFNNSIKTETTSASGSNEIDFTIVSSSCQTDINTTDNLNQTTAVLSATTSELLECEKRLRANESAYSSQDMFHKLCDRFLSKDLAELVKAQTHLKCANNGNRYTIAYEMFCLNLYYVSPQAYRLLEKTLCLPCRSPFNKLYIPMTTQITEELLTALKLKVNNMSEREKHCTLVMDAMSLKSNVFYDIKNDKIIGFHEVDGVQSPTPAKYALVVIIRGIFVKWSQPIGYALLSECSSDANVSKWIDKLIIKLFEIGLKIRVCVSDMGPDMLKAAEERGICVNKTYFTVNGHKIYYIFDAPHLIKLVHTNLMAYDFHFQNGAVAKFCHIKKFYEHDKKKSFRQAHKLTNSHMYPTNFDKLKVRYATQLLSRSVAAGLSTYIDFNVIDESARHTVELIMLMNDIFDALNSSSLRDSYKYKRAFCGRKEQIVFFNKMLIFFRTLKLRDPRTGNDATQNVNFIQGFQITIQSILHLYEDLKQEGYQYILTRRLNQDVIEIFFGKIRSKNGIALEPTSRQFISAYRKIFFANITRAPKEGNCTEDLTESLVHLSNYKNTDNDAIEIKNEPSDININQPEILQSNSVLREISCSDYTEFDIPEKNAFFYVCGAILQKCIDRHEDCEQLKSYLNANQQVCNLSAESRYLHYKKYSRDQMLLVAPPDDFVENIKRMEQIFQKVFKNDHINCKIGMSVYEQIKDLHFSSPCPCFPKLYLQKLFIRMRIYYTLKFNNRAFRNSINRRKYFSVANL